MKKGAFLELLKRIGAELMKPAPSTPQPARPKPIKNEPYVYITAKGTKFHYDLMCPAIRNAKEIKMDLSKARKAGYTACDKCCYNYLHE
jgi:hypothetical protein